MKINKSLFDSNSKSFQSQCQEDGGLQHKRSHLDEDIKDIISALGQKGKTERLTRDWAKSRAQ